MSEVQIRKVGRDEGELRLDRWFRRHFSELTQVQLQKLLRSGQVRVDGKRAKASDRIEPGMSIRIPPMPKADPLKALRPKRAPKVSEVLVRDLLSRILYRDADVLIINKPAGLAVQGGTGTTQHLDGALDELRFGHEERPRLVHRLDRDTAGVMILARHPDAARKLAESFRRHKARKYYWAVTLGRPTLANGRIEAALAKSEGSFEKMERNEDGGRRALTFYSVIESAGRIAAWVALWPVTGRTHQLRAHLALINAPILGDPKYGQKDDFGLPRQLHLFARRLIIPHPKGGMIDAVAPLPDHFKPAFSHFGFSGHTDEDPFKALRGD